MQFKTDTHTYSYEILIITILIITYKSKRVHLVWSFETTKCVTLQQRVQTDQVHNCVHHQYLVSKSSFQHICNITQISIYRFARFLPSTTLHPTLHRLQIVCAQCLAFDVKQLVEVGIIL